MDGEGSALATSSAVGQHDTKNHNTASIQQQLCHLTSILGRAVATPGPSEGDMSTQQPPQEAVQPQLRSPHLRGCIISASPQARGGEKVS